MFREIPTVADAPSSQSESRSGTFGTSTPAGRRSRKDGDRGEVPPAAGRDASNIESASERNPDISSQIDPHFDPLTAAVGHSIRLDEVLAWQAGDGLGYLSPNAKTALEAAADMARAASPGGERAVPVLVTMSDVLAGLVKAATGPSASPFALDLVRYFPNPGLRARLDAQEAQPAATDRVRHLRWDVVEVLAEASRLRARTNEPRREIGLRHIFVAAFRVKAGQMALRDSGFMSSDFAEFRKRLADFPIKGFSNYGDDLSAWTVIFAEVARQEPLVRSIGAEPRASYASDRVTAEGNDPLGVTGDAKALADLILLEAARPPLAIGVFGPWGSGKSTLLAHLKKQIRLQTEKERAERGSGQADEHPDTRRVANVIQLDFNAWTFADSSNLWATFAAEIFDQLAAGGIDHDEERHGARLVAEVAARNSRETVSLRTATAAVAQNEAGMEAAKKVRDCAQAEVESRFVLTAADTIRDMLGMEPRSASNVTHVSFDPPEKKADRDALQVFHDTVLGSDGDNADRIVKRYAESANAMILKSRALYDFALGPTRKRWITLSSIALLCLAVAVIWEVAGIRLADLAAPAAKWEALGSLLVVVAGWVWWLCRYLAPAVRFAALYNERLEKRRREAQAAIDKAQADLETYALARSSAEQAKRKSEAFITRYGTASNPALGASPSLMLDYLLRESESVAAIRQREGLLAIVRRSFDQLDSVTRRMREEKQDKAIDRIILYIDDLDRCSARQVTEILQAIHLLLAFECFVVVAAVDARWLRHSLESEHEQFAPRTDAAGNGQPDAQTPPSDKPTAADYLEKIFQVAFWVRPLIDNDAQGDARFAPYASYVDQLFGDTSAQAAAPPLGTGAATGAAAAVGGPVDSASVSFAAIDPRVPDEIDLPRRERLLLTPDEQALFRKLGALAAKSPRAVKRMINIYRLMRVGYRDGALDSFLGDGGTSIPSYRAVLFVLACEMGLHASVVAVMDERLRALSDTEWKRFSASGVAGDDGRPLKGGISLGETYPNLAAVAKSLDAMRMFHRFQQGLDAVRSHSASPLQHADMVLALDDVRRFSFRFE